MAVQGLKFAWEVGTQLKRGSRKKVWRQLVYFSGHWKMWEHFAKIPLEFFRQSTVNQTVYLFPPYPRTQKIKDKNHPEKLCIVWGNFLRPKKKGTHKKFALQKCSIFTLKNYALLTEFHPEFPYSGQTMPKWGCYHGTLPYRTLPYRTQLSSVHYKCLFASQLNCGRSWVILDSDPQFLPLSFADFLLCFFSQRNRKKMHLIFFRVFLFFFVGFLFFFFF